MSNPTNASARRFIFDGTVSELHTEISQENWLDKVFTHYKGQGVVDGVAVVVRKLVDQAGSSATQERTVIACANEL